MMRRIAPVSPGLRALLRHVRQRALLGGLVVVALGTASSASAEIYKYRNKNGEVVVTTEPRSDLELIEIIGERKPRSSAKKASSSSAASSSTASSTSSSATPQHRNRTSAKIANDQNAFDHIIREAAEAYDLPFAFIKAVIKIESNFNTHAVSRVGAMGLMQLMPATAESLGVTDAFDARQNIFGGARYLRKQVNRYNGDINLVLSAYNAGPGNVDKYGGIPFESTARYVQNVYRWYQRYQELEASPDGNQDHDALDEIVLDEP